MPRQKSNHVDSPVALAARLRKARERAGLSQRALARGICTPAYVSRLEKGERIPSLQLLRQLGERLGADADELASGHHSEVDPLLDAELALRFDELDEAERLYRAALADGEPKSSGALAGLGQIAFRRGAHREAIDLLEQALRSPASLYDESADTLGRAYAMVGELESAISVFERALARAEQRHDDNNILRFAVLLANALVDAGSFGRASELLGDALARAAAQSDPLEQARLWWSQSRLHSAQGQPDLAARYARRALDVLEATEHTLYTARALQVLAHIELDRREPERALDLLDEGLEHIVSSGNPYERAVYQTERARALAQLARPEEAAGLALDATALLTEASPTDAGRAYLLVAQVFDQLGERARAQELYELAIDQMPVADRYLNEAYSSLAGLLEADGRTEEALELLKRAVRSPSVTSDRR